MAAVTWGRMRTFLAVVDHGSVRAAAGALHVSEPAVSAAVTQLERSLSTDLFGKQGRGLRLTEGGEVYARYCRRILGLLDEAASAVRDADKGRLRIGAVATASEWVLPSLLASFRDRHPDVELSLSVRPRAELFSELTHHEADLVLGGRPPSDSGLVTRASRANTLVVVAAPDRFRDATRAPWLLRGPGSGTRETTSALLTQLDLAPATLTLGTHGAVLAAAREGLGVTLVHADAVAPDLAAGRLVQIAFPRTPLKRPWYVTTTESPSRTAKLFIDHITDPGSVGGRAFQVERGVRAGVT
jgi:DNA-binding transcriptional LysR family regulator